jgi:hypothetical protein
MTSTTFAFAKTSRASLRADANVRVGIRAPATVGKTLVAAMRVVVGIARSPG